MEQETKKVYGVTGSVRSGTSMMMKMLKEGGLDLFYTTPDEGNEFNPDGYFETAYLKGIHVYHGWIENVYGKAIKVFAPQLHKLPDNNFGPISYKFIYMDRDPIASAQSFAAMKGKEMLAEDFIIDEYNKTKTATEELVAKKPNIEILYVNYTDVLANPETECQRIKDFLGLDLNLQAMVAIPDVTKKHY